MNEFAQQFEGDLANGKYTPAAEALEDGEQWLQAAREIDVCNWYSSPTWSYGGRLMGEVLRLAMDRVHIIYIMRSGLLTLLCALAAYQCWSLHRKRTGQ
ncbi:hypothetical protein LL965_16160 [Xanthomonas cassavae CFBP 4642]|uniref:Uncharacterized protein n=1 Tax=Xanthomonas cassavae CFBP 4642 TaxID=1219375 RepID=A0ABS8HHD8_9XANT|nr:hypothetical protein [Xanthomonas cassavae]MCC4621542.1 hypothetical protein [Xanthomonas cassavae CFBP 4642]